MRRDRCQNRSRAALTGCSSYGHRLLSRWLIRCPEEEVLNWRNARTCVLVTAVSIIVLSLLGEETHADTMQVLLTEMMPPIRGERAFHQDMLQTAGMSDM